MKKLLGFALMVVAFALSACEGPVGISGERYGSLVVLALDDEGAPLPGVQVEIRDAHRRIGMATTRSDGRVRFDFLAETGYLLAVTPPAGLTVAHANPVLGLYVREGERQDVVLRLTDRLGGVRVAVESAAGIPVDGVQLELRNAFGWSARGVSKDGAVLFTSVPSGAHLLNVTTPDSLAVVPWEPVVITGIEVVQGDTAALRVTIADALGELLVRAAVASTGERVRGVGVEVHGPARMVAAGTTNASGNVVMTVPEFDAYEVRVLPPPGFRWAEEGDPVVDSVEVVGGERTLVRVWLEPV